MDFVKKRHICQKILATFDKIDPGLSQSRGLTLISLAESEYHNPDVHRMNVVELLEEAVQCLKVENEDSHAGKRRIGAENILRILKLQKT